MAKSQSKSIPTTDSSALKTAVARILTPLVALLIEHGLTYQWLSALLKTVFIDVAEREFRLPEKRQTDSRITLLTGVHRKDVRRLRQGLGTGEEGPPASVYLGAHLVAIWTSENKYLDRHGKPKRLPRLPVDDGLSFEELVTSVSKDIRPRVVLDEWLRLGAVEVDEDDCVRLKTDAFVPAKGFDEKAYYLGRNVHDHIAAARYNVQGGEPPLLERSVYYDDLSAESVRELQEMAREEGMKVMQAVNRRARDLQARDRKHRSTGRRINFGVYFFQEDDASDSDELRKR